MNTSWLICAIFFGAIRFRKVSNSWSDSRSLKIKRVHVRRTMF